MENDFQRVEISPIRDAVLEYIARGHTMAEICRTLGWMKPPNPASRHTNPSPDSTRLRKSLGLEVRYSGPTKGVSGGGGRGKKYVYYAKHLSYRNAVKIVRAIDRDPFEFDL